jgi:murein DD-endopeptidase MepM/ murein hydrolase activator NlpD
LDFALNSYKGVAIFTIRSIIVKGCNSFVTILHLASPTERNDKMSHNSFEKDIKTKLESRISNRDSIKSKILMTIKKIFDVIFYVCYITGLMTQHLFMFACEAIGYPYHKISIYAVNIFHLFLGKHEELCLTREYRGDISIGRAVIRLITNIGKEFANFGRLFVKKGPFVAIGALFMAMLRGIKNTWNNNKSRLSYIAPVIAVVIFAFVIFQGTNLSFGLTLNYKGKTLGMVRSESVFTDAVLQLENRITSASGNNFVISDTPKYSLAISSKNSFISIEQISSAILSSSDKQIIKASGLFIDGNLYAVNKDGKAIQKILDDILAANGTNTPNEKVEFVKNIEVKDNIYPIEYMKTLDDIKSNLTSTTTAQKTYVTVKGDAPSLISDKFNMKLKELYALNVRMEKSGIKVGQQVIINKAQPMLGIAISKNIKYNEKVDPPVTQTTSNQLYEKQLKVAKQGAPGVVEVLAAIKIVDGVEVQRTVLQKTEIVKPVAKQVIMGTKPIPTTKASGIFLRPVTTGYYSSPFGWRTWGGGYKEFHTGLDIATSRGTPIVAADGGTVIFASYSGGFGKNVIINHGNGYTTLYGHCNTLLVKVGDKVFKGQQIATVGMTGRATGNHVHFQVTYKGQLQNPAKLIK